MKRKKYIFYYAMAFAGLLFLNILSVIIFRNHAQITKYSIPAIALMVFAILYGLAACIFKRTGNFLRYNYRFLKYFIFNFFEPEKEFTFTVDYEDRFNKMLAIYFIVIPFYIPCIFFSSTAATMPIAVIVFLVPQIIFVAWDIFDRTQYVKYNVKYKKQEAKRLEEELKEQQRREEMGRWK